MLLFSSFIIVIIHNNVINVMWSAYHYVTVDYTCERLQFENVNSVCVNYLEYVIVLSVKKE